MDADTGTGVVEQSNVKNRAGIYVDPQSGAELICKTHVKFGSAQADAAVRVGYVYDRPLTEDDLKRPAAEEEKPAAKK